MDTPDQTISSQSPTTPLPSTSPTNNKIVYISIVIIALIIVALWVLQNRFASTTHTSLKSTSREVAQTPIVYPTKQLPKEIIADKKVEEKLVPVVFDYSAGSNGQPTTTSIENNSGSKTSPTSGETITPLPTIAKNIHLDYLFSAYMSTITSSEQSTKNSNLFGIGGIDSTGNKYRLTTYTTSSDKIPRAVFTSDGSKVAYQGQMYIGENDSLYVYYLDTKKSKKISDKEVIAYGGWNKDNTKLAFFAEEKGKRQWFIYDDKTQEITDVPVIIDSDDYSLFAWGPHDTYAISDWLTYNVFISSFGKTPTLINDFDCEGGLMFSQDGRFLTCLSWLRLYDTKTQTVTKKGNDSDWYFFYSPIFVNASYKTDDPLLLVYKEGKAYVTSVKKFFLTTKPVMVPLITSPEKVDIIRSPSSADYDFRFINDDQALSMGSVDHDKATLMLVQGFSKLSMENPRLSYTVLSRDPLAVHGFSKADLDIQFKE